MFRNIIRKFQLPTSSTQLIALCMGETQAPQFTPLQKEAINELVRKNYSYSDATKLITEYDSEDLQCFITQKYRDAAKQELHLPSNLPVGNWFNSYEHVKALKELCKKYTLLSAISIIKPIKDTKELKCIALGASHVQSHTMTELQKDCFISFSEKMTPDQALQLNANEYTLERIHYSLHYHMKIEDAIKLNNLMNASFQTNESLHDLLYLLVPRLRDYRDDSNLKNSRSEYKPDPSNHFHPGDIVSALVKLDQSSAYHFSLSENPYGVTHLLFHVMGLEKNHFEKITEIDIDFIEKIKSAKRALRKNFPDIAEYADTLNNGLLNLNFTDKSYLLQFIRETFGEKREVPNDLIHEKEAEMSIRMQRRA